MSVYNAARLSGPLLLTTTDTTQVGPVIAGQIVVVKQIIFTNTSGASQTVNVNVVSSGSSVLITNRIISELSIGANSTVVFALDIPLVVNETLTAKTSAVSSINATTTGIVIT